MITDCKNRLAALTYGVACHGTFLVAIASMIRGLDTGMQCGLGRLSGGTALFANALLAVQFPLLHSLLLTPRGGALLERLAPHAIARDLRSTLYALVAAVQILATFVLWSPSGIVLWRAHHGVLWGERLAHVAAWALLGKALWDAGLPAQTGSLGWWAVFTGRAVEYGPMPQRGLFRICRQPIYLGFMLILWTARTGTPDVLALAGVWSLYCVLGPIHKERRFARRYGAAFRDYRQHVPYFLPRRPAPSRLPTVTS